eukprot:CAMPEP_0197540376 /NCGR_PEP_ID=MMETSP1318-20131121/65578_1 /TAXON_ID=552666 /ORGANISM="Partenskyella glossopodia, Strain RCC365" /LENGTH=211 /DNA_ID=CAMNT_0043099339 /DNA_START=236 /DNA_END=871 /DNA_ORIENTATION=-
MACSVLILLNLFPWANDIGTIGLYKVHFSLGITGWKFAYNCINNGCPQPNHTEEGGYGDDACRWDFCEHCLLATQKMTALSKACIAFASVYCVLALGRAYFRLRDGFFGKLLGVFTSILILVTSVATWALWLDKCQNQFATMSYIVGNVRVVNIKPQLYYAFVLGVLGSTMAILTAVAEAVRLSFSSAEASDMERTEDVVYSLALNIGGED